MTTVRVSLLILLCVLISGSVAPAAPADFKDPYNGAGHKLSPGGGEPGRAYTAFIDAAYKKDHAQMCKLMAAPAEVPQCLDQKQALDVTIAMFTQPKSHKVLGGYIKGNDATLNVEYAWPNAPASTGFVVMSKASGRWSISSSGGSGSATITAEAGGQIDLGAAASAPAAQSGGAKYTGPALGKWTFEGKDSKGVAWTGTITISEQDSGGGTKYIDCSLDATSGDGTGSGAGSECEWDAAKREVRFGPDPNARYTAVLSADGRKMTQGKWSEGEKGWNTQKVTVKKTGVWSAEYAAGQK